MHAQRQIKTKHARSIKYNSHNTHLYIHHRLAKKIQLDPPSQNYLPSSASNSAYTSESLQYIHNEHRSVQSSAKNRNPPPPPSQNNNNNNQFREYILNEQTMQHQSTFDDAMVAFLLDMQNRDL